MTEQTAKINGVTLTETQLREGLAQIEAAKAQEAALAAARESRVIRVGDSLDSTYINIPPAVAADIAARHQERPREYVTLGVDGHVNYNFLKGSSAQRPVLKGFTS